MGNVITFKPKKEKTTPKLGNNNFKKELGHKYSSIEKYEAYKTNN